MAFIDRRLRTGCGLSHAGYQVLAHLSEAPDGRLRSFELGESRLSQHLSRMQTRGLVVRERSQANQRGTVVTITPQGLELISAAARQHVADARDAVIDQLTQTDLKTLATITGRMRPRLATLDPVPGGRSPAGAHCRALLRAVCVIGRVGPGRRGSHSRSTGLVDV